MMGSPVMAILCPSCVAALSHALPVKTTGDHTYTYYTIITQAWSIVVTLRKPFHNPFQTDNKVLAMDILLHILFVM